MLRILSCIFFLLGFALALPLVELSPLKLSVSASNPQSQLNIHNETDETLYFQCIVMAWPDPASKKHLIPTNDFVVTPPILAIQPGYTDFCRFRYQGAAVKNTQPYRLLLMQVLQTLNPIASGVGVKTRVNHNLPLYVLPNEPQDDAAQATSSSS